MEASRDATLAAPNHETPLHRAVVAVVVASLVVLLGLMLFGSIDRFGFWLPTELDQAIQARDAMGNHNANNRVPMSTAAGWLLAWGTSAAFAQFGVHEWSGRLLNCLGGSLTLLLCYLGMRRGVDRRCGLYAVIIAASSPLFLLNSLSLLGDGMAIAAHTLVGVAAFAMVLPRTGQGTGRWKGRLTLPLWSVALLVGTASAIAARGALLGALPPLWAATATGLWSLGTQRRRQPPREDRLGAELDLRQRIGVLVVGGLALTVLAGVLRSAILDQPSYSSWLGGSAQGMSPSSFDAIFSKLFHSFAPWSALFPFALGGVLLQTAGITERRANGHTMDEPTPDPSDRTAAHFDTVQLSLGLVVWASLSAGAYTLFASRYGQPAYLAVAALAGCVALFLRNVERSGLPWRMAALLSLLLLALLLRDLALYPSTPLAGLAGGELSTPEAFNPRRWWAALFGVFAAGLWISLVTSAPAPSRPLTDRSAAWRDAMSAPSRFVRTHWHRGGAFRVWLLVALLVTLALVAAGVVAWVAPEAALPTLQRKWGRRLMALPPVVWLLMMMAATTRQAAPRLPRRARMLPLLLPGLGIGLYVSWGFLPAVSAHFSPREVLRPLRTLARSHEALGVYRLRASAAAFYTQRSVQELNGPQEAQRFLAAPQRRWIAFPIDDLGALDQAFRNSSRRHLFMTENSSGRMALASNQTIGNGRNVNPLARYVLDHRPPMQYIVDANLDNKVSLLGYDLVLPHRDHVGAGEHFELIWYWQCKKPVYGKWQGFLHVDGRGLRIHGDHDLVEGMYPIQLWQPGDVIVDRQRLFVPAHYRIGEYTLYAGLFQGGTRMHIVSGPADGEDRIIAGVLHVR